MVNKGRIITYRITVKHKGKFSEKYLEALQKHLWEYFSDVAMDDIKIRKTNP